MQTVIGVVADEGHEGILRAELIKYPRSSVRELNIWIISHPEELKEEIYKKLPPERTDYKIPDLVLKALRTMLKLTPQEKPSSNEYSEGLRGCGVFIIGTSPDNYDKDGNELI